MDGAAIMVDLKKNSLKRFLHFAYRISRKWVGHVPCDMRTFSKSNRWKIFENMDAIMTWSDTRRATGSVNTTKKPFRYQRHYMKLQPKLVRSPHSRLLTAERASTKAETPLTEETTRNNFLARYHWKFTFVELLVRRRLALLTTSIYCNCIMFVRHWR